MDSPALSNVNSLWGAFVAGVLAKLGVRQAVLSPGSRSTPLTFALAREAEIEALPVLDERSAAFYALGLAKRSGHPVVLVCTSGTAAANYLPAVIEAKESQVPLLVLTTDRPPEMRDCRSGQTIDQIKLFGGYVRAFTELGLPETTEPALSYLRQTLVQAVRRSHDPIGGPVHINFPFRDPLAPEEGKALELDFDPERLLSEMDAWADFDSRTGSCEVISLPDGLVPPASRGLVVAGSVHVDDAEVACNAVFGLAQQMGWPVVCDVLGPWRTQPAPEGVVRVAAFDSILRDPDLHEALRPDFVLQIGQPPTSKFLRQWLGKLTCPVLIAGPAGENLDPLHRNARHINVSPEALDCLLPERLPEPEQGASFRAAWAEAEADTQARIDSGLTAGDAAFEGNIVRMLFRTLGPDVRLFISNSMPVRDAEWFVPVSDAGPQVFFSRGANGIDGTLSTALGCAHGGRGVLLTGDLALLHDTNGFLAADAFDGSLTVVLINNAGGGIFESLPVSKFDPPFERYFATPQQVDFARLASAYGVAHILASDINELQTLLREDAEPGVRVIELRTDRKRDMTTRRQLLGRQK